MGNCKYCGKSVGFLRNVHKECNDKHTTGVVRIKDMIKSSLTDQSDLKNLHDRVKSLAADSYITGQSLKQIIHSAWGFAVDRALEDGVLSETEESRLLSMIEEFGFEKDTLHTDQAYIKLVKGGVLREVLEGKIPERLKTSENLPFNFQKSEKLVWLFQDVKYHEMRTKREFRGGHHGISMRIAKGLYYRTGAFRGYPVETSQMVLVDRGILAVTNSHLYFAGSTKTFRIKYNKIISFEQYSDGLGMQRDAMTAKPQIFQTNDGWFTCNLIMNLAKRE